MTAAPWLSASLGCLCDLLLGCLCRLLLDCSLAVCVVSRVLVRVAGFFSIKRPW